MRMPSAVIRRFAYDHSTAELWVELVTGRRYVYSDVPDTVAAALGSAFAKGAYFNSRIRGRFPHREIVHEDESQETQS
jgi:KTSC domain-containing protein